MNDSTNHELKATLQEYVRAFETKDCEAVAECYHLPCMFISPFGVRNITDNAAARELASQLIEQAVAQGYRRTETFGLEIQTKTDGLATMTGIFSRRDSNDQEIMRFGFSYTLLFVNSRWRIVVAIAHGID